MNPESCYTVVAPRCPKCHVLRVVDPGGSISCSPGCSAPTMHGIAGLGKVAAFVRHVFKPTRNYSRVVKRRGPRYVGATCPCGWRHDDSGQGGMISAQARWRAHVARERIDGAKLLNAIAERVSQRP